MSAFRVNHLIYTNAQGSDGRGFRGIWPAPNDLPTNARAEALAWLKSARAESSDRVGIVLASPSWGGRLHVACALIDSSCLVDEHKREAGLWHLVFVPVAEEPLGDLLPRLLRQTLALFDQRHSGLDAFVAACASWRSLETQAVDGAKAPLLDREVWPLLDRLAAAQPPSQLEVPAAFSVIKLTEALLFLPPRLRLAIAFSESASAPEATRLRPGSAIDAAEPAWARALIDKAQRDPDALSRDLEDRKIRSLAEWRHALEAPRTDAMSRRPEFAPSTAPNTAPVVPAAEQSALEKRLERYVDQRLSHTVETLLTLPPFYFRWRVEIWGLLILALLALQWAWLASKTGQTRPTTSTQAASTMTPARPSAPTPLPTPSFAEWLRDNSPRVQKALLDLLAAKDLKLTLLQRTAAQKAHDQLKSLKTQDVEVDSLRLLLFEYVAKRGLSLPAGDIDLVLTDQEYPATKLEAFATSLGVAPVDLRDARFQAKLVMAFLEKNG
jgi:hypothetical protein